jgi:hypothetical protein
MATSMPLPDAPSIQAMQLILTRYHQRPLDELQPFMAAVAEAAPHQVGVLISDSPIASERNGALGVRNDPGWAAAVESAMHGADQIGTE